MDTGSGRKILIIEDESDVADLLEMGLRKAGFKTTTAADGAAGLQKARDNRPDFIILDLMLPKMSGLEVCRILKGDVATSHIPILMLTAKAEEIDRIVGLEFGADDYVTKPFSPREVIAAHSRNFAPRRETRGNAPGRLDLDRPCASSGPREQQTSPSHQSRVQAAADINPAQGSGAGAR